MVDAWSRMWEPLLAKWEGWWIYPLSTCLFLLKLWFFATRLQPIGLAFSCDLHFGEAFSNRVEVNSSKSELAFRGQLAHATQVEPSSFCSLQLELRNLATPDLRHTSRGSLGFNTTCDGGASFLGP